ncbi:MAG: hypothetical protein ABIR83_16760, partial [Nakamurella sp.]
MTDLPPVTDLRHAVVGTPVGDLTVVGGVGPGGFVLTGVYFPGHRYPPSAAARGRAAKVHAPESGFEAVRTQLAEYFDGRRTVFELP